MGVPPSLRREVKVLAMAKTLSTLELLREIQDDAVQTCYRSVPEEEGHRHILAEAPHTGVRGSKERGKA